MRALANDSINEYSNPNEVKQGLSRSNEQSTRVDDKSNDRTDSQERITRQEEVVKSIEH